MAKNKLNIHLVFSIIVLISVSVSANAQHKPQAKSATENSFDGAWLSCHLIKNKNQVRNFKCGGYYFVQSGKNICGYWNWGVENSHGQIQAIQIDLTHAKILNICGVPSQFDATGFTNIYCKEDAKYIDGVDTGWESAEGDLRSIQLCYGNLFGGNGSCKPYRKKDGYFKRDWKPSERIKFIKTPWVAACLRGIDLKNSNL